MINARFEQVQGQRSVIEHGIVKSPQVKLVAQGLPRLCAQRLDLEFSDLVAQRLSRLQDVAVDLRDCRAFGHAGIVDQVADRLVTRPAEGVQSGFDYKLACVSHLRGQVF